MVPPEERAPAAPAAAPAPTPQSPAIDSQLLCLVVDDSRVLRKLTRRVAEGIGYTVLEAENGEEALIRCARAMPALVITDWNMPVMSGLEFVSALRAMPGGAATRVVFCTSNAGARDIHQGIEAGADEYVIKPFDEATLKAKLASIGAA